MKELPTRAERQRVKNALAKKFWGNAYMGSPHDRLYTTTFNGAQIARREAWMHGMAEGFRAGIRLAKESK